MTPHDTVIVDGGTVMCRRCGTAWDARPFAAPCPAPRCPGDGDGPVAHHFGADGHCHVCGEVDRG